MLVEHSTGIAEVTGSNPVEALILSFIYQAAKDWNSLPTDLNKTHFLSIFKSKLKTFLKDFD